MNTLNVNRAMLNRVNTQDELKTINKRIDGVVEQMSGVDVVFRPNEYITGTALDSLLTGTNLGWMHATDMKAAVVYEAQAPSYIDTLRPGLWNAHIVDANGKFMVDTYSPLEVFNRRADGSVSFNTFQASIEDESRRNYGGNIQHVIEPLISGDLTTEAVLTITSNVLSSTYFNADNLYYIQVTDLISNDFNGGRAASFTLHFE